MLIAEKKIWTPDNSFLLEYAARIEAGEIIVGRELWQELQNLKEDMTSDAYLYDTQDALIRMDFMEHCIRLTKSPFYNKPMVLMLWQKAFIEAVYSFKMSDTTWRRFKRVLLLIARKNTKSETCSALGTTELAIGKAGMDIVCASNDDSQASPTTEKEKVAEKTPQKRVKVIVENAAETAIETVRLVQKTEETENLEPELGEEEDTAEENTEGENETGTKQGKTEETDQSDKNKSGKKKNSTVADTTDSNKPPHDGMIYDVNAGTWIDMPEVHSDGFDRSEAEEVWSYVNAERTAAGLNALTWDEDIYNFACQRAQAIVSDFSHNGCGNYGENIALNSAGSAYRIHMQWFYSTGHHNNYMLSSYVKGACAIYVYQGVWYAVENFALEESENSGGTLSCNAYGLEAEAALNEYIDSHDW